MHTPARTPSTSAGLAAVVAVSFALVACSGDRAPGIPTPAPGGGSDSGSQATPEAAGETFLRALGTGDAKGACAVMAADNQPIASIPQAKSLCETSFGQVAQQAAKTSPDLAQARVTGARVSGDSADFASAQVSSQMGQGLLGSMRAVKIKGTWFITS